MRPSQRDLQTPALISTQSAASLPRRRFLLALGASGAGAAAVAAAPTLASTAAAVDNSAPAATTGYRETEHVRDYYDSARL
jgi:hypothetical protein